MRLLIEIIKLFTANTSNEPSDNNRAGLDENNSANRERERRIGIKIECMQQC